MTERVSGLTDETGGVAASGRRLVRNEKGWLPPDARKLVTIKQSRLRLEARDS